MSDHHKTVLALQDHARTNAKVFQAQSDELRRLDGIIKGTRLILAGLVHQVGGEVVLDEKTLRLMESGNFTMSQKSQSDPISVRIVVTEKSPEPDATTEENDGES